MVKQETHAFARESVLHRLEIAVTRKLDGLLHGEYQTMFYGPGAERGDSRAYQPGDDARRIDWNASARSGEIQLRDTLADRELDTWLVVDASESMYFGTATCEKKDLALTAAGAFGLLGSRGGNRIGAVIFDGQGREVVPPRAGRPAIMSLLRRIEVRSRAGGSPASLTEALRTTQRAARRRGRIVVISDLIGPDDWQPELRRLGMRHDVIVVQIRDPRDWSLPPIGLVTFADPETGRRVEVQTNNAAVRQRFANAASQRTATIQNAVSSCRARQLTLSTDRDWMLDIVAFARRPAVSAGAR